jgi:hypothetical protein
MVIILRKSAITTARAALRAAALPVLFFTAVSAFTKAVTSVLNCASDTTLAGHEATGKVMLPVSLANMLCARIILSAILAGIINAAIILFMTMIIVLIISIF